MHKPDSTAPEGVSEAYDKFADLLRDMRDRRDPRLNSVLAAAKLKRKWPVAVLADLLRSAEGALSKRIERASPAERDEVAQKALRTAIKSFDAAGLGVQSYPFWRYAAMLHPEDCLRLALTHVETTADQIRRGALSRTEKAGLSVDWQDRVISARAALERAEAYRCPAQPSIRDIAIPKWDKRLRREDGVWIEAEPEPEPKRQLSPQKLFHLKRKLEIAKRVNRAVKPGDWRRKVSLSVSKDLWKLLTEELEDGTVVARPGINVYSLSRELGMTHRGLTMRLKRHGYPVEVLKDKRRDADAA